MDISQTRTGTLARALGSALAMGLVGVAALPATAQAAGVRGGGLVRTPAPTSLPLADPAALPVASPTVVRYRVVDGQARHLSR